MKKTMEMMKTMVMGTGADVNLDKMVLASELALYCLALPEIKKLEDLDNVIAQKGFDSISEAEQTKMLNTKLKEVKKLVSFKDGIDIDDFGVEYVKILGSVMTPEELEVPLSNLMSEIKNAAVIAA